MKVLSFSHISPFLVSGLIVRRRSRYSWSKYGSSHAYPWDTATHFMKL
jgi:hypothetical protein